MSDTNQGTASVSYYDSPDEKYIQALRKELEEVKAEVTALLIDANRYRFIRSQLETVRPEVTCVAWIGEKWTNYPSAKSLDEHIDRLIA